MAERSRGNGKCCALLTPIRIVMMLLAIIATSHFYSQWSYVSIHHPPVVTHGSSQHHDALLEKNPLQDEVTKLRKENRILRLQLLEQKAEHSAAPMSRKTTTPPTHPDSSGVKTDKHIEDVQAGTGSHDPVSNEKDPGAAAAASTDVLQGQGRQGQSSKADAGREQQQQQKEEE
eukprot:CAMPEP_0206424008 /NCGR_PEP_ID=MMETSP0324_2-20121206/2988_1 /ASSEMBLY_ACC=CAM_ASM_000836 /TAXON_ID=2866 /ORGANISM="Crypthecodinium cohnii, Strain Seligo" /LENGTH=173 /DNA_ID=CAMNT_0053888613 /DNA_START=142 /DNA_END=660 /DNA_ORIENTATION=+